MKHLLSRHCLATLLFALCSLTAMAQDFSISPISDAVFQRMQGKSFAKGCTTPRSDLRYLTVLHYDLDGHVQHGELVCNKAIAQDLIDIFRELYKAKYPIERMRLIDDYEADDEQSMRHNNTSSFCFRIVSGTTSLSKHARGMAIDINPLYNPYVHHRGGKRKVEPAGADEWTTNRTKKHHPCIITPDDLCLRLFLQHGFRWGGNWKTMKDYQHFEK